MVTPDDIGKLKVSELKEELKKLDLPINGLKAVLVARLTEAVEEKPEAKDAVPESKAPPAEEVDPAAATASVALPQESDVPTDTVSKQDVDDSEKNDALVADLPPKLDPAVNMTDAATPAENPATSAKDTPAPGKRAATTDKEASTPAKQTATPAKNTAGSDKSAVTTDKETFTSAKETATPAKKTAGLGKSAATTGKDAAAGEPGSPTIPAEAASKQPPRASESSAAASEKAPTASKSATASQTRKPPDGKHSALEENEAAAEDKQSPALPDAQKTLVGSTTKASTDAATKGRAEGKLATLAAPANTQSAAAEGPSATTDAEPGQGPDAIEEDDGAPEVDFEADVEEEVEEVAQATQAANGDRKRKAPSGDARESIKAARLSSGKGDSTPRSGRLSSGLGLRVGIPVPLPNRAASRALRIDGLMRPFTKTQSSENAETIRQATFGIQWPKGSQKRLTAKFVDEEEALSHINGTFTATQQATLPEPSARVSDGIAARLSMDSQGAATVDARQEILDRRNQRQAAAANQTTDEAAVDTPTELGLDDLFRKTDTEPFLYWLPAPTAAEPVTVAPQAAMDTTD